MVSIPKRITLYLIGLSFALQPSYLHPDEHFQSLEILFEKLFQYKGSVPWEFNSKYAARSFVPLYVFYGPIFCVIKLLRRCHLLEQPLHILRFIRFQNWLMYMTISRLALKTIENGHSITSIKFTEIFVITSYITWSYQSHTFSNSTETILLLWVLVIYRKLLNAKRVDHGNYYMKSIILGVLITLGVFNRITFAGFIFLPFLQVFYQFYSSHWTSFCMLGMSIVACTGTFVFLDTLIYQSPTFTIAPLNNLLYNLDESNLALHGIHPRFTHVLVNLPQISGPGLLLLASTFSSFKKICQSQAALSVISGLAFLSVFKHQELRFLIPLAPLIFSCFAFKSPSKMLKRHHIFQAWMVFNIIMGVVMCVLHQGGIVRAINDLHQDQSPVNVHIWWKTYSPPTWMYMNRKLTVSSASFVGNVESLDGIPFHIINDHVVDLRGSNIELLIEALEQFNENRASITLLVPNSVRHLLDSVQELSNYRFKRIHEWKLHLDLDHIDLSNLNSLSLGLVSYNVSYQEAIHQ